MKTILVGLGVVTLTVSTAFAGDLKIEEKEDVVVVEYYGSAAGRPISIDEAAELAEEDQARAAIRQLQVQQGSEENGARRDSANRRAHRAAAKTAAGVDD